MPKNYTSKEMNKARWTTIHNNRFDHETDIWGIDGRFTPEEAFELMYDRLPHVKDFTIQREIMEMPNLPANAKIMYLALSSFPSGRRWRLSELAGLTGLTYSQLAFAEQHLTEKGLIEVKREKTNFNGRMPAKYTVKKVPSRFDDIEHSIPRFLSNDLSNIEDELRSRFYLDDIITEDNKEK